MAVGKGSMDRASRAVKKAEPKMEEEKKTVKKTAVKEETEEKKTVKKSSSKKVSAKKDTSAIKETAKDKEEVKATVIASTDQQVLDLVVKTQEEKEEKKTGATNTICGIGDDMPVYFL
ncbi:MAG: hypothetical protein IKW28_00430 [Lachnospiraceae bacterium]|nr:hypothetical protein [Lachnospiraceae bacterium]